MHAGYVDLEPFYRAVGSSAKLALLEAYCDVDPQDAARGDLQAGIVACQVAATRKVYGSPLDHMPIVRAIRHRGEGQPEQEKIETVKALGELWSRRRG